MGKNNPKVTVVSPKRPKTNKSDISPQYWKVKPDPMDCFERVRKYEPLRQCFVLVFFPIGNRGCNVTHLLNLDQIFCIALI